jgi:hypothetical protein
MTYYMIRHKATGEYMPELDRTRGYSFWNPAKVDTVATLGRKVLGTPRLFPSRKSAHRSIVQWNAVPNGHQSASFGPFGEDDIDIKIEPDGRSKDDLEIVEVDIIEVTNK